MTTMKIIEELKGLPATGPMYIPFASDGVTFFSEGYVLKISENINDYWIANFQNGYGKLSEFKYLEGSNYLLVVAQGSLYEVDLNSKKLIQIYSSSVCYSIQSNDEIVFADLTDLLCFNKNGMKWKTDFIGIDGVIPKEIKSNILFGEWFDPLRDKWFDFKVNMVDGEKKT
jgi:hypothetical protein